MKRTLVLLTCLVLTALLFTVVPLGAEAAQGSIYVVRPGDTLYSIASRYCMSWQELYNLNSSVITNPNQLYPGMQLQVVNRCGGSSGGGWNGGGNCGQVYDRGPRLHAQGFVQGNIYTVVLGDTAFSIGQRFGISSNALGQANGINPWLICAGQHLVIPRLGQCQPPPCSGGVCQPCSGGACQQPCNGNACQQPCNGFGCQPPYPVPTVIPIPITPVPTTPVVQPAIQVTSPAPNATLPPTFTVTGTGQGLFEGSLVVRAQDAAGNILAQQPTTLQGTNVGAGGPGTFSVQLTVNVPVPTNGSVVAFAPQSPAAPTVSVPVTFSPTGGGSGVTYKTYTGGQCMISVIVGHPYYATVGGPPTGSFTTAGTYTATQGAKLNSQLWFHIGPIAPATTAVWTPITGVSVMSPACWW